jgi:hypothetical protein
MCRGRNYAKIHGYELFVVNHAATCHVQAEGELRS